MFSNIQFLADIWIWSICEKSIHSSKTWVYTTINFKLLIFSNKKKNPSHRKVYNLVGFFFCFCFVLFKLKDSCLKESKCEILIWTLTSFTIKWRKSSYMLMVRRLQVCCIPCGICGPWIKNDSAKKKHVTHSLFNDRKKGKEEWTAWQLRKSGGPGSIAIKS